MWVRQKYNIVNAKSPKNFFRNYLKLLKPQPDYRNSNKALRKTKGRREKTSSQKLRTTVKLWKIAKVACKQS